MTRVRIVPFYFIGEGVSERDEMGWEGRGTDERAQRHAEGVALTLTASIPALVRNSSLLFLCVSVCLFEVMQQLFFL